MNFKEMNNADKIAAVMDGRYWAAESIVAQEYINALHSNNSAIIEEYETFGDCPHSIVKNKMTYERALAVYGFTEKTFSEYGWLETGTFEDCETFRFGLGIKGGAFRDNSITIGRSPNKKWTYGLYLSASKSGSAYGLNVFNEPYLSRHECLREALAEMIEWHERENDRRTAPVIREAQDMLDEITGRKRKQMSLFDL
jgi:hypothetical protein